MHSLVHYLVDNDQFSEFSANEFFILLRIIQEPATIYALALDHSAQRVHQQTFATSDRPGCEQFAC